MKKLLIVSCMMLCLTIMLSACSIAKPEDIALEYVSGVSELDFEKIEANSIVPYETIFMAQINAYMQQNQKTEKETWEMFAEIYDFENVPQNFAEYKEYFMSYTKKEMKEQYGDDFTIKVSFISSEDKNEEEIRTILSETSDYYDNYDIVISDIVDFSEIKKCKEVTCKIYLSGEKVEEEDSVDECSVYVVKSNNQWKVLNLGISA